MGWGDSRGEDCAYTLFQVCVLRLLITVNVETPVSLVPNAHNEQNVGYVSYSQDNRTEERSPINACDYQGTQSMNENPPCRPESNLNVDRSRSLGIDLDSLQLIDERILTGCRFPFPVARG